MAKTNSYHSTQRTRKGAVTSFGSRTDIGSVREQNEDSLVVAPPLYVVADGMGGHAAGEVASEIAVRTLQEHAPKHPDPEALGAAVEQANCDIIDAAAAGEGREGMGTTCTACMLEGTHLVIAQVGDSRAYLLHQGGLTQLTRDHSLMANMIEAGQLTPEEARFHPNRSVITRALGNDPNTTPDLYEINVEDGDRLLVCSDGLTSMVEDDAIAEVMARYPDPQKCATALVNEAIAGGGADNITVIVVNVDAGRTRARKRVARRTKFTVAIVLLLLAAIVALAAWGGAAYLHNTAYLAAGEDGYVEVYRGVPGEVLGLSYSELVEKSDVKVADLSHSAAERIAENMRVSSVDEALALVDEYRAELEREAAEEAKIKADREQIEADRQARESGAAGATGADGAAGTGDATGVTATPGAASTPDAAGTTGVPDAPDATDTPGADGAAGAAGADVTPDTPDATGAAATPDPAGTTGAPDASGQASS